MTGLQRSASPADPDAPTRRDGRSERWSEHRRARRAEIVDATIRALNQFGPSARMEQIAEVAGTAKPKLYRHFTDRGELVDAVGAKVASEILRRLSGALDGSVTIRVGVTRALDAYMSYVEQNPNVIRFLLENANPGGARTNPVLENARGMARLIVAMVSADLTVPEVPLELVESSAHTLIGAVLGATDWWILTGGERKTPRVDLVDHLVVLLLGAMQAMLTGWGIDIDPDVANLGGILGALAR